MSDNTETKFNIHRLYLKSSGFKIIDAPESLKTKGKLEYKLGNQLVASFPCFNERDRTSLNS